MERPSTNDPAHKRVEIPLTRELHSALTDYFREAPFDERLDSLLDQAEVVDEIISYEGMTTQSILPGIFEPNGVNDYGSFTEYKVKIISSTDQAGSGYRFEISDPYRQDGRLLFEDTENGTFSVFSDKDTSFIELNSFETAKMAFRMNDISDEELNPVIEALGENGPYKAILKSLLKKSAEVYQGTIERRHYLSTASEDSTHDRPKELRLCYTTRETGDNSSISLTLEKAHIYPELETEQVKRLEVELQLLSEASHAKQIVRGDGGVSVRSIRALTSQLPGTERTLNSKDADVLADFIDIYEELIGKIA